MGEFVAVSGVIGASSSEVQAALKGFAEAEGGGSEMLAEGVPYEDPSIGVITLEGANTSVLYPEEFSEFDKASKYLSTSLSKPVFSFHIHDGDLWMYTLFDSGREIDHFNPLPDYWGNVSASEREKWRGDASVVAKVVPGVSVDVVGKYLVAWDVEQMDGAKAYPDDEFAIGDCWQMSDFMRKVGLQIPMDIRGEVLGAVFRFSGGLYEPAAMLPITEQRQKPWWKFW
ncbi:MAG TPA: hypothetical protein VHS28_06880 [Chloroflexota bacterium]|nr:hypothetical protein [Chloroflexota bacterium]